MQVSSTPTVITDPHEPAQPMLPMPRLVVLGRADNTHRHEVILRLDASLLQRLDRVASGPRSLLVETALRYMVEELEQSPQQGPVFVHAQQIRAFAPQARRLEGDCSDGSDDMDD